MASQYANWGRCFPNCLWMTAIRRIRRWSFESDQRDIVQLWTTSLWKGKVYFLLHLQPTTLFQVQTVVRLLASYSKHLQLCFTLCAWWFLPENRQCLSSTDKPAACDHIICSVFLSDTFQSSSVMTKGFTRPGTNSANPLYFCTYPGNWRESFCRKITTTTTTKTSAV